MPQVSFSADIKPLFRAVDISHMKRFGVELDGYTLYVESGQRKQSARDALPARWRAPRHASRWTLLDAGPARIIRAMAERRIPAVTFFRDREQHPF